jgi:chorismate mutase
MPGNKMLPACLRGAALALAVFLAGCAHPPQKPSFTPSPAEVRLAELMAERLEIARHVAWVKFQNNLPVADPAREAELLASLVSQGAALGLAEPLVTEFFSAQIRASRRVQEELIGAWRKGAALPAYPPWDLRRHIRPKLDRISAEMLDGLRQEASWRPGFDAYAASVLRQRGFSFFVIRQAVAPLP